MNDSPNEDATPKPAIKPRRFAFIRKWIRRITLTFVGLIAAYGGLILIGLIPVNRDFVESEDGIEVFVLSGAFHSDIILPTRTDVFNWHEQFDPNHFGIDTSDAPYIGFGWGDRNFYLNTPSWSDLKISTATNALLIPSETVMHVGFVNKPATGAEIRSVKISPDQYQKLVDFVLSSFNDQDDAFEHIQGFHYGSADAFFVGNGSYHCFRTCNCWVGDGLKAAGIKTGWFTPLPKTVFRYLPE